MNILTHEEINSRFFRLDMNASIMKGDFHGWWAWPIVKERLWLYCLNTLNSAPPDRSKFSYEGISRVVSGAWQLLLNGFWSGKRQGCILYEERLVELPDGRRLHPHLGDLAQLKIDTMWLRYRFPWGGRSNLFPRAGEVEDYGISALVAIGARFLRRGRMEGRVANAIVAEFVKEFPTLDPVVIHTIVSDQLARFRCRFMFSRWLLRRWRVSKVVVLDADGKVAEVAAAKSLGLEVIEVQHGMFSAMEPDYSWRAVHREIKLAAPFPDKIVVFGPLWASQLRDAAFWQAADVVEAQNPVVGEFRLLRQLNRERGPEQVDAPIKVLFSTQAYVQPVALSFLANLLKKADTEGRRLFQLSIKIHPLEKGFAAGYHKLADDYPHIVSIIPEQLDAFEVMSSTDVVVGYTSLMLIEALGMDIPVVGLVGGGAGSGISEVFNMPELDDDIILCGDEDEFLSLLSMWSLVGRRPLSRKECGWRDSSMYTINGPKVESILMRSI